MTDLNKEREALVAQIEEFKKDAMELWFVPDLAESYKNMDLFSYSIVENNEVFFMREQARQLWSFWNKAKAQAVTETHVVVEKSKIETWWQDAEEPENFASRIEDMLSLGQYITGGEIMEITEHHTIHLPSKTIYGVWVDKDGDRSFCTGTLEECQALEASESGAEQ
ncbi:hypothetical protein ABFO98_17635 [Acinetobacter baumannii]